MAPSPVFDQGPYDAAGYDAGNMATWPQFQPPAVAYQPGMWWTATSAGTVDGEHADVGDYIFVHYLPRTYGQFNYGDGTYGDNPHGNWPIQSVGFTVWDSAIPPRLQPPFPYAGCPFDDDRFPGWRIVVDALYRSTPSRTYGQLTYGDGVYGDTGAAATPGWADITRPAFQVNVDVGTDNGAPAVDVTSIAIEMWDDDGDWFDIAEPAYYFQPFVGDPIRVGFLDPGLEYHPICVGVIETIRDEHDTLPRYVTVEAFGNDMDLANDHLYWQRPAELASQRFAALMVAGGWRFGSGALEYPGDAALHADVQPIDITTRTEIDRTVQSAGWFFDTTPWGEPRLREWPHVPTGEPLQVVDCATPAVPQVDGYLTPTVGTVTTPDPGPLPAQHVFVFKVNGPVGAEDWNVVASQFDAWGQYIWRLESTPGGAINLITTSDGMGGGLVTAPATTVSTDGIASRALAVTLDDGGLRRHTPLGFNGAAWITGASVTTPAQPVFDGADPLRIGAWNYGATGTFNGAIYSVELRTGLDPDRGTVVWRFDANDYPGTGTSYVDPRGRTWTLTNAAAITPKVPEIPAPLVSHRISFGADTSQLLNVVSISNQNDPQLVITAKEEFSVAQYGRRSNAMGFPLSGLAFADSAAAAALAVRYSNRWAFIVRQVSSFDADTDLEAGWLAELVDLDTGRAVTVTRNEIRPLVMDAVIVGYGHRITPKRIESSVELATVTTTQ